MRVRRPRSIAVVPLALFSLFLVIGPAISAEAATSTYFLKGTGVPQADLSTAAPTSSSLPNYDPGSDSDPGRKLDKSDAGWNESDSGKYQSWVAPGGELEIDGQVTLTFWSAMKDFDDEKEGRVEAYLLDCAPGGSDCVLIDQGSRVSGPWSPSESWVSKTIDFGSVSYSIASNRSLAIKVVVGDDSDDDMFFAYDTASFPSRLTLQTGTPATTTTVPATTTTVPATTPTTTPPVVTTTTPPSPAPPSTDTSSVETTTTTGPGSDSSSTTLAVVPGQGSPPTVGPGSVPEGMGTGWWDGSGATGDSMSTGFGDPGLAAIGAQESSTESSTRESAWAGRLLHGLELVIPRWAVGMVASPLLVLGFVVEALTDSGRAVMLPLALLGAGLLWVVFENRGFTMASIRRRDDKAGT